MNYPSLVTGPWTLKQLKDGSLGTPKNGLKVFSCFHCGGGSTMGYKLAGFDVLGGVEIDKQMMDIYRTNHNPRHSFLMGIQDFNSIPDEKLPSELFDLDVLDGSPPCSSFSMAGSREKAWGVKKKFREGQAEQVLDDLFFHFIDTAKKLRPKVVIAENVKGLILGNARGYVKQIFNGFKEAGYSVQLFLLNSSRMGVPQRRERTFFVANRLGKRIGLDFKEPLRTVRDAFEGTPMGRPLPDESRKWWAVTPMGESFSKYHPKGNWFGHIRPNPNDAHPTIVSGTQVYHYDEPNYLSDLQVSRLQSFPDDYDFKGCEARYVCGMSVPPLMMQRLATEVLRQLF